jgi:hypothetical protein
MISVNQVIAAGDLAREMLADAELDALDLVATWRLIARAALGRLHEQHREMERLRDRHRRVVDEYRKYRAVTICAPRRPAA